MGLYERITGVDGSGRAVRERIVPEVACALLAEYVRARLSSEQAREALQGYRCWLTDDELAELRALAQTVTSLPAGVAQLARMEEIRDVLLLARARLPGYASAAEVRARLAL